MRLLVVSTVAAVIHFVAAIACMFSAVIATVVAAAVLVPLDMNCSLVVGSATVVANGVVATVAASDAGAANVAVSVVAVIFCAVAAEVVTWFLSTSVLSKPLVCSVQTFPSPSGLS